MLKGIRLPLLALAFSILLLTAVISTRPSPPPAPSPTATQSVIASVTVRAAFSVPPTITPAPTLTPAPTIPVQAIDTSVLSEAVVSVNCFVKLNPLLAGYNSADRDASALIFDGLMKTNEYGAAIPSLASGPARIAADGLTYVLNLRQDVRWHDGEPFTSADVAYTVGLMQAADFPGPAELHMFWETVEFDALDAFTVRFRLAQPLATFLDYLRIGILPEHVLRGTSGEALRTHPFNLSPIGTGPYQFERLLGDGARLRGMRLRRAPNFAARPEGVTGYTFETLNLLCYPNWNEAVAAFQRGEVNTVSEIPPDAVQQIAGLPLLPLAGYRPALGAVIFNWGRDSVNFFRDQRMRRALAYAIDRRGLVETMLKDRAIPADGPILPNSWAYASSTACPTFDPNNPSQAQDNLALVQITPPPTDPNAATPSSGRYTFELLVPNDAGLARVADAMVSAWSRLNMDVALVVVDSVTFRERLSAGSFDAALVELNLAPAADPDPYSLWRQLPRDGGLNFGAMNDRSISELLETARRATDGATRIQLYRSFQQVFCDRAAALVLYYPVYYYGVDARIAGVQPGFLSEPADRFRTIQAWRFETP